MKIYSFGCQDGFANKFEAPAFLLEVKGKYILIDCPANINLFLQEIGLSVMDLSTIVITHLHNDHTGGLVELIQMRMMCLQNSERMKKAGYYQNIVQEILPIYFLGYEEKWLIILQDLISFNCPKEWLDWQKFHELILPFDQQDLNEQTFKVDDLESKCRKTKHSTNCFGLKIGNQIAISADTEFDLDYLTWLVKNVKIVFHEAGYGGAHLKSEFWQRVFKGHSNLYFYHVPFPVVDIMKQTGFKLAVKNWYSI